MGKKYYDEEKWLDEHESKTIVHIHKIDKSISKSLCFFLEWIIFALLVNGILISFVIANYESHLLANFFVRLLEPLLSWIAPNV